jgi:hypothetical protein
MSVWMIIFSAAIPLSFIYRLGSNTRQCNACFNWVDSVITCEMCGKQFCKTCIASHVHTCDHCAKEITAFDDFVICPICGKLLCSECASARSVGEKCSICGQIICCSEDHTHVCSICENPTMNPLDTKECEYCGRIICDLCLRWYKVYKCELCGKIICENCAIQCKVCGRTVCPDCWNENREFPKCRRCDSPDICESCGGLKREKSAYIEKKCPICGRSVCSHCWNYNRGICNSCANRYPDVHYPRKLKNHWHYRYSY